ncbi:hypothetical protein SF06_01060 [Pseudomonas flexibilis]|nr:hypothetical protein SF06_01060 [Pseudomonas flexibilis]
MWGGPAGWAVDKKSVVHPTGRWPRVGRSAPFRRHVRTAPGDPTQPNR